MGKWLDLAKRTVSEAVSSRFKLGGASASPSVASIVRARARAQVGTRTDGSAAVRSLAEFDPYAWRMGNVLPMLAQGDPSAAEMIPWLEQAYPRLYAELILRLPRDLHRLWESSAPFDEFERVLQRWLDTHRGACALYQAHVSAQRKDLSASELETQQ